MKKKKEEIGKKERQNDHQGDEIRDFVFRLPSPLGSVVV